VRQPHSRGAEQNKGDFILLNKPHPASPGGEKKICFFVEMQFFNGYKCCVLDIEILRFSPIPFCADWKQGLLWWDSFISNKGSFFWIGNQNVNLKKEDLSHEEIGFTRCVGCVSGGLRWGGQLGVLET
jgi:hypothetical protein